MNAELMGPEIEVDLDEAFVSAKKSLGPDLSGWPAETLKQWEEYAAARTNDLRKAKLVAMIREQRESLEASIGHEVAIDFDCRVRLVELWHDHALVESLTTGTQWTVRSALLADRATYDREAPDRTHNPADFDDLPAVADSRDVDAMPF